MDMDQAPDRSDIAAHQLLSRPKHSATHLVVQSLARLVDAWEVFYVAARQGLTQEESHNKLHVADFAI